MDEALAGVDLVAKDLAEVTGLGAEDFLNDRCVAQPCKDRGDAAACLAEFRRDAGDKDGRLVHGLLLPKYPCLVLAVAAQESMIVLLLRRTSAETRVSPTH